MSDANWIAVGSVRIANVTSFSGYVRALIRLALEDDITILDYARAMYEFGIDCDDQLYIIIVAIGIDSDEYGGFAGVFRSGTLEAHYVIDGAVEDARSANAVGEWIRMQWAV